MATAHDVLLSTIGNTNASTSLTFALPTGWLPDDVAYVVLIHRHTSTVSITVPSGWTTVSSSQPDTSYLGVFVYRRVLQSGDTSWSWTVDNHTSGWSLEGFLVRSADTTTPEAATATVNDTASSTTGAGSNVTTSSDGALLVSVGGCRLNATVSPTSANGYRTLDELRLQTLDANDGSAGFAVKKQESSGSGSSPTWGNGGSSTDWRVVQFAVASASYSAGDPFLVDWSPFIADGAASQSPALPAQWTEGDVGVVVAIHRNTSSPTFSISTGWDLIVSDNTSGRIAMYAWKRSLQAGDSNPTVTPSTTSSGYGSYMFVLRNVTTTEDITASVELGSAWTTLTPSSVTTSTDKASVVLVTGTGDDNNQTFDNAQGFESLISSRWNTLVGSDFSLSTGVYLDTTAGSVTMPTVRQNNSPNDNSTSLKFAFQPAVSTQDLTGTLYQRAPTFFTGTIAPGSVDLAGTLFQRAPTFGTGSIGSTYGLSGALFQVAPAFFAGTTTGSQELTGTLFQNAPAFSAGTIAAGAVDLTGALFQVAPAFSQGAIAVGAVDLAGNLFALSPTFFAGDMITAQELSGALAQFAPSFFAGDVTSTVDVAGVLFQVAPAFPQGAVTAGPVDLAGVLFQVGPSFFVASLTGGLRPRRRTTDMTVGRADGAPSSGRVSAGIVARRVTGDTLNITDVSDSGFASAFRKTTFG